MIRTCDTEGCNVLTLGAFCLTCEQKEGKLVRRFPRGRPFAVQASGEQEHVAEHSGAPLPPFGSDALQ